MKISFATNLCAHYNVGTFELLAKDYNVDYFFFSAGREWYWPKEHGLRRGDFHSEYLPGFNVGATRITLSLPWKLWRGGYDIYIKCINGRFALPVTFLIAKLRRKPFILWTGVWMRLQTPIQRLIFPLTRYIYRHSEAIVVYGKHVKDYLVREGVPPERIFIAPHATDNSFYGEPISVEEGDALRSQLGIPSKMKIVLYLGRLEESKGVALLLSAFAKLDRLDFALIIAGNGSLQKTLEYHTRQLGIADRVRFAGYVPIESARIYYSIADIYVLPSITMRSGKEPWGLVINEAFNQGVPVIVSDAVGAAAGGLVEDGVNGIIVPENDVLELGKALSRMAGDEEMRKFMSLQAKKTILNWNYENNVQGYRDAIEYVLNRSPRR